MLTPSAGRCFIFSGSCPAPNAPDSFFVGIYRNPDERGDETAKFSSLRGS